MMKTVLLVNKYKYSQDITDVREEWIGKVLLNLGYDLEKLNNMPKSKVADILFNDQVDIIDYPSTGMIKISFKGDRIAEWGKPTFLLKKDDQTKEEYYEVIIESWTKFDK